MLLSQNVVEKRLLQCEGTDRFRPFIAIRSGERMSGVDMRNVGIKELQENQPQPKTAEKP